MHHDDVPSFEKWISQCDSRAYRVCRGAAGRYMDSDSFFRMAGHGRSIESWLAGLNDVHIDLWKSDPAPKPEGPHDRFFVIGLGGNPMTGAGWPGIWLNVSTDYVCTGNFLLKRHPFTVPFLDLWINSGDVVPELKPFHTWFSWEQRPLNALVRPYIVELGDGYMPQVAVGVNAQATQHLGS